MSNIPESTSTTPAGQEVALLPCPFCGGEAELTGHLAPEYWVRCPRIGCKASTEAFGTKSKAMAAWNARTTPPTIGDKTKSYGDALAESFCATPLPTDVCADLCATMPDYPHPRYGTNLLTVAQAKVMFAQMMPSVGKSDTVAFVQEWLMNSDYDPSQFDRDFAAAIDARCAALATPVVPVPVGEVAHLAAREAIYGPNATPSVATPADDAGVRDGWTPHTGGGNPLGSDVLVDIITRSGSTAQMRAHAVVWRYGTYIYEAGRAMPPEAEVVFYRLAASPKAPTAAIGAGEVTADDRELFILLLGLDAVEREADFARIRRGDFDHWMKMQAIARHRTAALAPASASIPADVERDRFANDEAAKALYNTWDDQPGWVPWVERGNSLMQERARREVML